MIKGEINIKYYTRLKRLGRGSFGTVWSAQNTRTGQICAVKIIYKEYEKSIKREIATLSNVCNPNIINYFGYSLKGFDGNDSVLIFMEMAPNKTLRDYLKSSKRNKTTLNIILIGIANGMKYLHMKKIIHRDLKPENIILNENYEPKITDMGTSKIIDNITNINQTADVGTPMYMAPEVIDDDPVYSFKSDVFFFWINYV